MAYKGPVDLNFVQRIIDAAQPEDQELEYKRELPKKLDATQAKLSKSDPFEEFAKDVSAMANASGGVLLYGVAEDDISKRPAVYPITNEPFDQAQVRLHSVLDSLIEPRLMGVSFSEIRVDGGYVLGIRVPGSLAGPHWHGKPERRRFSIRRGGRVSEYTYQELRAAFDRSASAATQAREWVGERLAIIRAGQTWRPLMEGPIAIVHLVPLTSYYQDVNPIDLNQARGLAPQMPRPWRNGFSQQLNFDGYIIYPGSRREKTEGLFGYTQLFRDGSMEVVLYIRALVDPDPRANNLVPARIAETIHEGVLKGSATLQALGKTGPQLIAISLMGVRSNPLPDHQSFDLLSTDRDELRVPIAYVEDPSSKGSLGTLAKTALDMLWQGFGMPECPYYDEQGNFLSQ